MNKVSVLLYVLAVLVSNTVLTAGMVYMDDGGSAQSSAVTCCLKIALVAHQTNDPTVSLDAHNSSTTTTSPDGNSGENLPVKIDMTSEEAERVNTLLRFIRNTDNPITPTEGTLTFGSLSLNLYQP